MPPSARPIALLALLVGSLALTSVARAQLSPPSTIEASTNAASTNAASTNEASTNEAEPTATSPELAASVPPLAGPSRHVPERYLGGFLIGLGATGVVVGAGLLLVATVHIEPIGGSACGWSVGGCPPPRDTTDLLVAGALTLPLGALSVVTGAILLLTNPGRPTDAPAVTSVALAPLEGGLVATAAGVF